MQLLTNSRMACFRACPWRHYLRYEIGLVPDQTSEALTFGTAWHSIIEAVYLDNPTAPIFEALDPFMAAALRAVVAGYIEYYGIKQDFTVLMSEREFRIPVVNPETGAPTRVWDMAGKIDKIIRLPDGRLAILEYKSTTRDFAPDADYWDDLLLDQQLSIYVAAARACGYQVNSILYDVVRRPGLKPLKATPIESRKYTKDGRLYANQRDVDETPSEYQERIKADIDDRPHYYFQRKEIPRGENDIIEAAYEVWQQQLAIREAQRQKHWYRNPGACHNPYPCQYLPVCRNKDLDPVSIEGFHMTDDVHPELEAKENG